MELSAEGLELIKTSEGFRSQVYQDVVGIPTIGYGHRVLPGESFPNGVGEVQATAILTNDVQEAEHAVTRLVTAVLTQGQFDALVDFCFNVGEGAAGGVNPPQGTECRSIRCRRPAVARVGPCRRGGGCGVEGAPPCRVPTLDPGRGCGTIGELGTHTPL